MHKMHTAQMSNIFKHILKSLRHKHFVSKQPSFDCTNDTWDLQTKVDLNQLPKRIRMACLL